MSQVLDPPYANKLSRKDKPYDLLPQSVAEHEDCSRWSEQFLKQLQVLTWGKAFATATRPGSIKRQISLLTKIVVNGRCYPMLPGVVQDAVVNGMETSIAIRKKGYDGYRLTLPSCSIHEVIAELHRRFDQDYYRLSRMIPVARSESDRMLWEILTRLVNVKEFEKSRTFSFEGKAEVVKLNRLRMTLRWYIEDEEFHIPSRMFTSGGWDVCKEGDWVRAAVTVRKHIGEIVNAMMLARIPKPKPMSEKECNDFMSRSARHTLPSADDEPI